MKILISLTYFSPHKSGLTVYAERLSSAMAESGHEVTVLTSRHLPGLPEFEQTCGVNVIRVPVWFRISKGVLMPGIIWKAWHLVRQADVVNLHIPQFEGGLLALFAKLNQKRLVVTYQSDLEMPKGIINKVAGAVTGLMNMLAASLADAVVQMTQDFADHSRFLQKFKTKVQVIPPPIVVEQITGDDLLAFRHKHAISDHQVIIGMAARLASEKGVEYLVEAMGEVLKVHPDARVLFAGEYQNVIGEEVYRDRIMPMIDYLGKHWSFLGVDSQRDRAAFYKVCNVLVLPSINNTESLGMVQVEALMSGTPVVSTDLPGVRQPAIQSGFGKVVPIKNSKALAEAILECLQKYPEKIDASSYTSKFSPQHVAEAYLTLFRSL
jgi:glycosyltransferase involved in cell wall biosynthesis